jgi:hypothetical protein
VSNQLLDKVKKRINIHRFYASQDVPVAEIDRLQFFAVRGFPKSGTNWLSNLLNLHPHIFSSGEYGFSKFSEARDHIKEKTVWTVCNSAPMKGRLDSAFENMIKGLMVDNARIHGSLANKVWLGDKTPGKAYPPAIGQSKCLYIIRDVRDVTVSRAYHLLRVKGTWSLSDFPKMMKKMEDFSENLQHFRENPDQLLDDLDWVRDNVRCWARNVEQVLGAESVDRQRRYPNYLVKVVHYEDLHANIETERTQCYRFLGLDPEKALPLNSGAIQTSPGFRSEQAQSFYRKGAVGDWKNYFNDTLQEIMFEEAGELLKNAGYLK